MPHPPARAVVFDAYGTLFDVAGAARAAAAEPGGEGLADIWPRLAEDWRTKQLSYTWLRSLMGRHADFAQVTADALDWALDRHGLNDPALRARLLSLYDRLPAYPEVPAVLAALKARAVPTAILSNGTPAMLSAATEAAGIAPLVGTILSVEALGIYKPHPSVYALATAQFGCNHGDILFVSSNGWDIAGAAAFGFRTAWVNRAGQPGDRLPVGPRHTLPDLTGIPALT
jgi:2-haloacid dehalogenase